MAPPDLESFAQIPSVPASEIDAAEAEVFGSNLAQQEVSALSSGLSRSELAERAAQAEHRRNERFRDQFEKMAVYVLWLSALSLAGIGFVWIVHLLMPPSWRWLSSEDLSHIQSILTAGLLVGVVGNHFKKRLG